MRPYLDKLGFVHLDKVAEACREWQDKNFNPDKVQGALAVCEEAGEVARAVLKASHGTRPETRGDVGEEIGDVLLTSFALADRHGLSVTDILLTRFERLLTLDFTEDPEGGKTI